MALRLRLEQLEAVHWIHRLGGFRAAARHLGVSQPAVSGRVRAVERLCGGPIFEGQGRGLRLTAAGRRMVRVAEQMVDLAGAAERRLSVSEELPDEIRMGVSDSFALVYLSELLSRIRANYPNTEVDLDIDYSVNLSRKLGDGALDIAFLTDPQPGPRLRIEPLQELRLVWVAGRPLRLPRGPLEPGDLRDVPIISNPRPSHLYRTIADWFQSAGETPRRLHTCTSLSIMAKLAVDGFGIALLPEIMLDREMQRRDLRVLRTRTAVPPHRGAIAYRSDLAVTPIVTLAREVVASGAGGRTRRLARSRPAGRARDPTLRR
jgi:DNA-binding transcriptional LysR family regulator